MTMSQARASLKYVVSFLFVVGVGYFFWKALRRNWASIHQHEFQLSYPYLVLSFACAVSTILFYDYAWYFATNSLSGRRAVTFRQTLAIVNTTALTKYLPGKIWSFAFQMYWLTKLGLTKSLIVYVNLINMLVSMVAAVMLGLAILLFASNRYPWTVTLGALSGLILLDVFFLAFHSPLLNRAITVINKLFRRSVAHFDISHGLMLRLHAVHLAAAVAGALGGYALCLGLGYHIHFDRALLLMSSMLLSDVIGFLAFMVPGGIGVRESAMYLILGGASVGSLAVVLPLASRIVSMVSDILLGVIAVRLMPRVAKQVELT